MAIQISQKRLFKTPSFTTQLVCEDCQTAKKATYLSPIEQPIKKKNKELRNDSRLVLLANVHITKCLT